MMDIQKVMGIIESILFVSGDPVMITDLAETIKITEEEVLQCIKKLEEKYNSTSHGIMISLVGKGVRLTTKPETFPYIEALFKPKVKAQLSRAALETLAIIMFKQPVTRVEIEAIRGVNVEKALNSLQEKNLITELGRKETPGRPILYAPSEYCMEYFGIKSISDIPLKI